ncbi:ABC transporter substrate-binding protein [Kamptonema animale CS-326]|jgi:multiple sugar transport system substrate-binding protein|uniref:ABC transporter substrate-binding protein n=1 Tax=Kamptonema animale TaxID=92934 RepID=UPI00232B63A6|nr:ABC transporter substrate-binding protein [Kamptonema animale]MDB9512950.1 ABC transporter substrate-binding protein [Kamptonema animale CS-326]
MPKRIFTLIFLFFLFFGLATCSNNTPTNLTGNSLLQQNQSFRIWWSQGFLPEENEVVARLIDRWEKESGKKAELRLIPLNSIDAETQKSLRDGNPPDVLYSATAETNLIPSLAWQNQLADVSDLIKPLKYLYNSTALEAVYFQNSIAKKRSYYSVPIGQQATHILYWRNILQESGLNEQEIPDDWDNFWQYWKQAQDSLRQNGKSDIYGLGLTMSALGTDTFLIFQQFLEAYNVKILDKDGNLLLKDPANREGIIKALKQYANFYKEGYVPPSSVEWKDSGNNVSFLESQSLMTANGTLSIPLTQKLEQNPYNKLSTDLYLNKMVTRGWPEKPGGGELTSILGVKQIVIFEASQHKAEAKSFLSYLLKPENLNQFLKEGGKGRIIPVMPKLLQDSYWNNPTDPHIPIAIKQLNGLTRPSYEVFNPAYSEVLSQNIWSKAILSIVKDGLSPEQAGDEAIAKIEQIFAEWK